MEKGGDYIADFAEQTLLTYAFGALCVAAIAFWIGRKAAIVVVATGVAILLGYFAYLAAPFEIDAIGAVTFKLSRDSRTNN